MILNKEDKLFLKGLKKMTSASEEDVKRIYILYRGLINKPEIVNEYLDCNCPSLIREMCFELVLHYMKNKKEIDGEKYPNRKRTKRGPYKHKQLLK